MRFSDNILKNIGIITQIFANIAVIVGILFLSNQIKQEVDLEKRRIAIEAIRQTGSNEFITAFTRLNTNVETGNIDNKISCIDDINYMMSTYDHIAILYINNVADKCIIKNTIYPGIKEFSLILNEMKIDGKPYPIEERKNLDTLLTLIKSEPCGVK